MSRKIIVTEEDFNALCNILTDYDNNRGSERELNVVSYAMYGILTNIHNRFLFASEEIPEAL